MPTQLCTNRNQRRRRRRRGAPRRRRRSPRIPHPPRRRPRMKTGNPASTMKSARRSSQSRARGYRGYRPRYQPSRSSMHRERAWRYRDVHPCRRRGGAGSMKPRMEPTISSWPQRCIRCRRLHSRRCHPRHPRRRRRRHRRPRGGTTGVRGVVAIGLCVQAPSAATRSPEQERREANDADQPALKLKTFDYSKQNGRSPTVISEDKEPADAAADKAALTNAARPMSQGARVRSTTAAGYKKNTPPENTQKNTKQPDPADERGYEG